jgi:hypothetical protein
MELTGLGGGIMVALAAGLWLVYLMPTWFKRREFAANERTEERRQHALQVLQETAPIPAVVRAKAIVSPTGEVTDRDRLAEAIQRSRDAQAAREASRRVSASTSAPGQAASARISMSRRFRRTRGVATLLLLAAIVTIVVQVVVMVMLGVSIGGWSVLAFSAVAGVISFSALGRLANMARRRAAVVVPAAKPMRTRVVEDREAARPPVASWTPVPIPKPIYLSRSEAPAAAEVDHLEQLRAAALESDRALREAQESPEVTPISQPERPAASDSRFARMGIVGAADVGTPDLDEVLRRRRAAG